MPFHEPIRRREQAEAQLRIQTMGISGDEQHAPQTLNLGMRQERLNQRPRQTSTPVRGKHKNVSQIRKRGPVGDHAGKSDLPAFDVAADTQGVCDGPLDRLAGYARRPIAAGEKGVNRPNVKTGPIK